jgi:hypothetical protein
MKLIPFKVEHLEMMKHREKDFDWKEAEETLKAIEDEDSFTAVEDGKILMCAGVVHMHHGRGVAWTYFAEGLSLREMAGLTRLVKGYLNSTSFHRVEMHVDCDFEKAHNWARHLGFEMECERMKAFTPDKRDCALYARVK